MDYLKLRFSYVYYKYRFIWKIVDPVINLRKKIGGELNKKIVL